MPLSSSIGRSAAGGSDSQVLKGVMPMDEQTLLKRIYLFRDATTEDLAKAGRDR
jgi:hypothetical protein